LRNLLVEQAAAREKEAIHDGLVAWWRGRQA
jgi:hypothetical protein